jgi:LPS sulfotransferase NodH
MQMNLAGRADTYFICATPRTGSSLLLGLLEATGVAGHPQAYFREPDEPLWADRWRIPRTAQGAFDYADYLHAALAVGRTPNGVFGAKLMWGTLDELVDKVGQIHPHLTGNDAALLDKAFGRTRFVYLHREDVLAQAVSWLRAEQTNAWYVGGNGEIGDNSGEGREPHFDADKIGHFVEVITEHNAAWQAWFSSLAVQPHVVRYEELAEDMVGATHRILDFVGVALPEDRAVVPRHQRQADALNNQWIERYRATSVQHHRPGQDRV